MIHIDRASYRNCDHRDSGGNASPGIECSKGKSKRHFLPQQPETGWSRAGYVFQRLQRGNSDVLQFEL